MNHHSLRSVVYLLFIAFGCMQSLSAATEKQLLLNGRVKDAVWNTELTEAKVYMYNVSGELLDSVQANKGVRIDKSGNMGEMASFYFQVPYDDAVYTFDVLCPGYNDKTVTFSVKNVKKSVSSLNIPVILLEKAPHKLGEVTVTASKIKFYNKGDTLVYNASAFQLAEGSMLDALISQLPGAEINDAGQIKVNGEFVESLLLNGKKFFDGNNQLMLENIAAYTVKSVEVYKGQTREEKWVDDPLAEKHLTMDVKLKKEYMAGILLNAQSGYGTDNRYMGRLFTSLFTPTLTLSLVGNINNLNDSRKPGKSDSWTPDMMPSGTRRIRMAGLNYEYNSRDEKRNVDGFITIEENRSNDYTTSARTNFLTGGNTYENSFNSSRSKNLHIETQNYGSIMSEHFYLSGLMKGRYINNHGHISALSVSFREEQADITAKAIEAIYSDGSPAQLDAIINRSMTRSDGSYREREIQFFPGLNYKIPGTSDVVYLELGVKYKDSKDYVWRDYNINYGSDPTPAVTKRQYSDNSPNHRITLDGSVNYRKRINRVGLGLMYSYRFENTDKDSYMYALDRLADMGIYGTLPEGYLASFDPSNSYTSQLIQNIHSITPSIDWNKIFNEEHDGKERMLSLTLHPKIGFEHRHFDYWRDGRSYLINRSSKLITAKNIDMNVMYGIDSKIGKFNRMTFRNMFSYRYSIETKTPDMLHIVDVVNDADPLNISLGNPSLRNEYDHKHTLIWTYNSLTRTLRNTLTFTATHTSDALVRGYTYDTSTGVRRNRTYNVDGNNSLDVTNGFMLQFGSMQQFTLDAATSGAMMNYADMIGVDLDEPEKSKVRTSTLSQDLKLSWQIGRQNIQLRGNALARHTTSSQTDFTTINARHFQYGVIGQFTLPAGFGISSDFNLYTRRGYGMKVLDTTDAIWNIRITYTPRGGRWVLMADGFDILHQLSNVNYAVNATGRTVSYSNTLPRYFLFSVQYRMSKQPKKR